MGTIESIFGRPKCLVGVVHLMPLPGSPRWGGSMEEVTTRAISDARALTKAGFDGLIVENFGDAPFARDFAGRGAVAAMSAVAAHISRETSLAIGVNVLRSDALSAVAVATAAGARFIRVNVHIGAAVTDQGVIQGSAWETNRAIREMAPELAVFADVFVKHAVPLGETSIERAAADTVERGLAKALIVTGEATGSAVVTGELERVRNAVPGIPVLVGSGVTIEGLDALRELADGIIVGSAVMENGEAGGPIDSERAKAFADAVRAGGGWG